MDKRHLVLGMFLTAVSPLAFGTTIQQTATVVRQGDVFTCHSVLMEIPSHAILADQTVRTTIAHEGQAVSGSQSATGAEIEHRMSCGVSEKGDTAVVTVKSSRSENGKLTGFATREARVTVTTQPPN